MNNVIKYEFQILYKQTKKRLQSIIFEIIYALLSIDQFLMEKISWLPLFPFNEMFNFYGRQISQRDTYLCCTLRIAE